MEKEGRRSEVKSRVRSEEMGGDVRGEVSEANREEVV